MPAPRPHLRHWRRVSKMPSNLISLKFYTVEISYAAASSTLGDGGEGLANSGFSPLAARSSQLKAFSYLSASF